jgi:hypothetical protein
VAGRMCVCVCGGGGDGGRLGLPTTRFLPRNGTNKSRSPLSLIRSGAFGPSPEPPLPVTPLSPPPSPAVSSSIGTRHAEARSPRCGYPATVWAGPVPFRSTSRPAGRGGWNRCDSQRHASHGVRGSGLGASLGSVLPGLGAARLTGAANLRLHEKILPGQIQLAINSEFERRLFLRTRHSFETTIGCSKPTWATSVCARRPA